MWTFLLLHLADVSPYHISGGRIVKPYMYFASIDSKNQSKQSKTATPGVAPEWGQGVACSELVVPVLRPFEGESGLLRCKIAGLYDHTHYPPSHVSSPD